MSDSNASQKTVTTTTAITNVGGDVGLTGANAVALADVLSQSATNQQAIAAQEYNTLAQALQQSSPAAAIQSAGTSLQHEVLIGAAIVATIIFISRR